MHEIKSLLMEMKNGYKIKPRLVECFKAVYCAITERADLPTTTTHLVRLMPAMKTRIFSSASRSIRFVSCFLRSLLSVSFLVLYFILAIDFRGACCGCVTTKLTAARLKQ